MTARGVPQHREDCGEGSDAQGVVIRDGDVMLLRLLASEPHMAASLPAHPVAENEQRFDELGPGNVPGKLHAAMTSSRT